MSSQLSAQALTAQTAITRMSIRRCSILPWQRGSSTTPRCRTRLSMDMTLSSQQRGHVIIHQARASDRNFMREPWVQLGPVPASARGFVLEHTLAPGALERTDLSGGVLAVVRLGNPCIAEEHGPVSHKPVANELTLATGLCTRQALVGRTMPAPLRKRSDTVGEIGSLVQGY